MQAHKAIVTFGQLLVSEKADSGENSVHRSQEDDKSGQKGQPKTASSQAAKAETKPSGEAIPNPHLQENIRGKKRQEILPREIQNVIKVAQVPRHVQGKTEMGKSAAASRISHLESQIARLSNLKQIVEKIQARAQLMRSGERTTLNVHLNPPKLGMVQIKVEVQGDQMRLLFSADRPEAASVLQEARHELQALVNSQGYALVQCEVENRSAQNRWLEFGPDANSGGQNYGRQSQENEDASNPDDQPHQRQMLNYGYNTMELVA